MELLSLESVADLLGVTTQTVRNMVKRGELVAKYPQEGKMGRPRLKITASSYGKLLLKQKEKRGK